MQWCWACFILKPTLLELLKLNKKGGHDIQMLESLPKDTPPFPDSVTCVVPSAPTWLVSERSLKKITQVCKGHSGSETWMDPKLILIITSYEADPSRSHQFSEAVFSAVKEGFEDYLSTGLSSISIIFHNFYKQAQTEQCSVLSKVLVGLAQPTLQCSASLGGVQPEGRAWARSRRELLGGSVWELVDLPVDDILPQISNPKTNLKISWIEM